MNRIEFFVGGVPEGRPRPRAASVKGYARMYAVKAANGFEDRVACVANMHAPREPMQGPVRVVVNAYWQWPVATSKRVREEGPQYRASKPDTDNVAKAILDVLTACGYWADDSQVAELRVRKITGGDSAPGTWIAIEPLPVVIPG